MVDNSGLVRRTSTSAVVLAVVGVVIFYLPNWAFTLLAMAMIGMALWEYFAMAEAKGVRVYKYFGVCIGMLIPLIVFIQKGLEGYFALEPFVIVIACLFTFVLQFTRRESSQALASIAVTMFGLLYISWLFSFFVRLKFMPGGSLLVAFVILVTKMGDVGAYLVGSSIGRRNLVPRISPHKTFEGTIGGLVFSLITAVLSGLYLPGFSLNHLIVLGFLLGVLAQVGDLAESLLKRDCGVKDSGSMLPGFGGMFDLVDSLLFTTPIFYFYVEVMMKR